MNIITRARVCFKLKACMVCARACVYACVRVCVRACVRVCVSACVRACVYMCARACACMRARIILRVRTYAREYYASTSLLQFPMNNNPNSLFAAIACPHTYVGYVALSMGPHELWVPSHC